MGIGIKSKIYFKGIQDQIIIEVVKKAMLCDNDYEFRMYTLFLQNYLVLPDEKSNEEKNHIISLAINELRDHITKKIDQITKGDIVKEICSIYGSYSKPAENQFFILIPSKIRHNPQGPTEIVIKNTVINLISSNNIDSTFIFEDEFHYVISRGDIQPYFNGGEVSFFQFSIMAGNKYKAAEKAIKIFELYRSIVNFSYRYHTITHQYGKIESLSLIRKPMFVFIFNSEKKCISENLDHYPIFNGSIQSEFDLAREMNMKQGLVNLVINTINSASSDLIDMICDLITLLNNALDNYYDPKICSINLWLIFEIAAMKEEDEKHIVIPP